jgi:hypothetical protein
MRLNRDWLYKGMDPARRKLGLLSLLFCILMALLWFGARIPSHDPDDHRLDLLSLVGQAGFAFGLAGFLLSSQRSGVRWAGAIVVAIAMCIIVAVPIFWATNLWPG